MPDRPRQPFDGISLDRSLRKTSEGAGLRVFSLVSNLPLFGVLLIVLMLTVHSPKIQAESPQSFEFESILTLEDMQRLIESRFPLGSGKEALRQAFVTEGKATLISHPNRAGVEKYIYDINLCSYYIWRWNISTSYDTSGHLVQAYVNGNEVFKNGEPTKDIPSTAPSGKQAGIFTMQRPRPEASKGENSLGFILLDGDSDPQTIDDQKLMGAGPSRVDPVNMGKAVVYSDVEPWRSIFDFDTANFIAPYKGSCS